MAFEQVCGLHLVSLTLYMYVGRYILEQQRS
jgi:hypothetical protein